MERRARLPLQRHNILATGDAEEARAFVGMRGLLLDMHVNGVFMPGVYLGYLRYGAAVEVRTSEFGDDYRLVAPLRGSLRTVVANNDISCRPRAAMLISPTLHKSTQTERDTVGLSIFFEGALLREQLAALVDEPPRAALEFAPSLDLQDGHGRSLARFARFATAELEERDTILSEPITARSSREFLATALLLHQPHNYSNRLQRLERLATPRDIKRAIDYIEANLDETIGLPEIAAAAGVPGRTLIHHFRNCKGTSPMRYLRAARYQKVRETQRRAEPEESITEVAFKWGFTHMGRFSVEYRKRFGESPSQTLRYRKATAAGPPSPGEAPDQGGPV
jgi:AraC-like DNA-binding protein